MSLFDIAPIVETVTVNGTLVPCRGVSMQEIVGLLTRFPTLRAFVWGGRALNPDALSDPLALMREIPEAIGPVIAAGCGSPGDDSAERIASSLPIDSQLDLLGAIFRLTMPEGIGPLAQKLTALFAATGGGTSATETEAIPPVAGFDRDHQPLPNGADSNSNTRLPSSV